MKPHLSIRNRLAASATVLVLAVVAVIAGVAYGEIRHSAIVSARQRAENISRQVSDMFAALGRGVRDQAEALAQDSTITGFLADRTPARAQAAATVLARINQRGNTLAAVELWDAAGHRLMSTRDTMAPIDSAEAHALMTLAAAGDGSGVGWLKPISGTSELAYAVIAAAAHDTDAGELGFYVERRTMTMSAASKEQMRPVTGVGTNLLIGNTRGDLWTNLEDTVAVPPITAANGNVDYERPTGTPILAAVTPIPNTVWSVIAEVPTTTALGPLHAMLSRLGLITLVSVVIVGVGAWFVSGSLTRPIADLVTVAEGMSAGDESGRVRVGRLDELGVLGTAFNAMAERITKSRASLEQSVAELRDAESRYHMLFDASPQSTWVYDLETCAFLAVNAAAVRRYGYCESEFLSMSILDIHSPDDRPLAIETMRRLGADGGSFQQPWRHRTKDGSVIDVEVSSRALSFGGRRARLVVANDLTDRRRAEAFAIAAQERLARVIGSSGAVLYELRIDDAGAEFEWMSDNVTKILGYDMTEVQRPGWWQDNLHPDDRERLVNRMRPAAFVDGANEYGFRHRNGTYRWLREEARLLSYGEHGEAKLVGAWLDITEQHQLEERLRQTQKMEAVGRLAGGIAHDFNNLLAVISGFTEILIAGRPAGDPDLEALGEVKSAAARAAELTRQLLAFGRKQMLRPHNIDINAVIGDAQKMLGRLAGEDVTLVMHLDPNLPLVRADPGQVEQVLMNLVVNARDAMPEGGTVRIETRPAELDSSFGQADASREHGQHVAIIVADTGTGMPPEIRDQIFEPFFTTKEPGKGTGLGLSTVHGIVEQSGGRIFVYSEPGEGTTFKLYLPSVAAGARSGVEPVVSKVPSSTGGRESILLVEDDPAVRKVTASVLSRAGYSVIESINGVAGLQVCADPTITIDLVVTDMVMPEMGGRELARCVRSERPGTPMVFMSGYTRASIDNDELIANARFVEKPFTADTLLRAVRDSLDQPELTQAK